MCIERLRRQLQQLKGAVEDLVAVEQHLEVVARPSIAEYYRGQTLKLSKITALLERLKSIKQELQKRYSACVRKIESLQWGEQPETLEDVSDQKVSEWEDTSDHFAAFQDARARVGEPIVLCKWPSSLESSIAEMKLAIFKLEFEAWLMDNCNSLRHIVADNPSALSAVGLESCRRAAQRRLLIDAVLSVCQDPKALNDKAFRSGLLSRLPCSGAIRNVTWCEATSWVHELCVGWEMPSFEQRLAQIAASSRSRRDKVVAAALLMRGCFTWSKKGKNDFRNWIYHGGAEPNERSSMNCWEAVYFAAYKAGALTQAQIKDDHKGKTGEGNVISLGFDQKTELWSVTPAEGGDPPPTIRVLPQRGDVVFAKHDVYDPAHVVLSMGPVEGTETVMSLWTHATGGTFDLAPLEVCEIADGRPIGKGQIISKSSTF